MCIAGLACAVPDNCVRVADFAERFGAETTAKFTQGTGIAEMYKALPDQTASDLAFAAAEQLLTHQSVNREKIGLLLFVTQSPDYRRPATACVLQKRLGLSKECAAMDIGLGCSGFVYGLQTARSLMSQTDAEYGLLLLGETASKLVNPSDKSIAMMYGDAGAAVLLARGEEEASTLLRSDGDRFQAIILPAGGFRDMNPPRETFRCNDGIERSLYDIYMEGTSVFSFSISDVPKALRDWLAHTGHQPEDFDAFAFHQANRMIIQQIAKRLKIPFDRCLLSLDRYGNTGGMSIPLSLCDAWGCESAGVKRVLMSGFGIGLSWGVTEALIDTETVYPIVRTADAWTQGRITPEMLM